MTLHVKTIALGFRQGIPPMEGELVTRTKAVRILLRGITSLQVARSLYSSDMDRLKTKKYENEIMKKVNKIS